MVARWRSDNSNIDNWRCRANIVVWSEETSTTNVATRLYCVRDVEAYTAQTIYHHAVLLDYSGCKRDRSPEICTSHTCYSARWVLDQYGLKKIPSKNFKVSRGSENWDTSDLQTQTVGIFTDSVSAGMQSPQAPFVCPSVCTE